MYFSRFTCPDSTTVPRKCQAAAVLLSAVLQTVKYNDIISSNVYGGFSMKIIAHRCGTDAFPQQTIHGARYSLAHGTDLVEVDIRFTSDNVPVVIHDATPLSLYGTETPVCEMTVQQFLALRRTDDAAFCGHSFRDYLDCGIEDMLFHIKEGGERLNVILDMCREYGILKKVVFGVTAVEDVKTVKNYDSGVKVLGFMPSAECVTEFAAAGADYIRLWQKWLSKENIEAVRKSGKELWIMAKSTDVGEVVDGDYQLYESTGADGVLVNQVIPAIAYYK